MFLGRTREIPQDRLLGMSVMTLLGLIVTGFRFRMEYIRGELDYNNEYHVYRFWLCMGISLAVSFACGYLPVTGWPFLLVYVMLSLFSNMSTGILASSVLLLISVTLCGAGENVFALYFISGVVAATVFQRLESDFRLGIPLSVAILTLLVCETAGVILTENARPSPEMFVIPVANMIVSSLLLLGCLRLFSSMVVYRHRSTYLDINDTESPALVRLRDEDKQEYMMAVHIAYFCERIARALDLDADALKCAAYYHSIDETESSSFPPDARKILNEYRNDRNHPVSKETAVLVCAEAVVTDISRIIKDGSGADADYERVIDGIFDNFLSEGSFDNCDITMAQMCTMKKIFKREKLYYDFLR